MNIGALCVQQHHRIQTHHTKHEYNHRMKKNRRINHAQCHASLTQRNQLGISNHGVLRSWISF